MYPGSSLQFIDLEEYCFFALNTAHQSPLVLDVELMFTFMHVPKKIKYKGERKYGTFSPRKKRKVSKKCDQFTPNTLEKFSSIVSECYLHTAIHKGTGNYDLVFTISSSY
jgi:hypothetical protein